MGRVSGAAALVATTPVNGAVLYGSFVALAQTGFHAPDGSVYVAATPVSLSITAVGGSRPAFSTANVNTLGGVPVGGLAAGVHIAKWVVTDANGDTRTVRTRFVERPRPSCAAIRRRPPTATGP